MQASRHDSSVCHRYLKYLDNQQREERGKRYGKKYSGIIYKDRKA